jgi:Protein of unknown function (DUF3047)
MPVSRATIPLFVLALAASSALVTPAAVGGSPLPPRWQVLGMPGKVVTRFTAANDGAIAVDARDSVGFLYRAAAEMPGSGRYLTWRWRVDAAPPPTDLSVKGMDDRPLAVHVWFNDGEDEGWDFKTRLGAWLFDRPLPGKMLTYVWGGTAARGTRLRNPYREKSGYIVVLRPGNSPTGEWHTETVDVEADFEAVFGYRPGAPEYVAISADTDDKGGASTGVVAGLSFTDKQ